MNVEARMLLQPFLEFAPAAWQVRLNRSHTPFGESAASSTIRARRTLRASSVCDLMRRSSSNRCSSVSVIVAARFIIRTKERMQIWQQHSSIVQSIRKQYTSAGVRCHLDGAGR